MSDLERLIAARTPEAWAEARDIIEAELVLPSGLVDLLDAYPDFARWMRGQGPYLH